MLESPCVSGGSVIPPPLIAESTVGGAISIIQARLVEHDTTPLVELLNPLMSMIVYSYLGSSAARKELNRSIPAVVKGRERPQLAPESPFKDLPIRITFRTARVLGIVGAQPGASNRGRPKLRRHRPRPDVQATTRLEGSGLIENRGQGQVKGEPNAWQLTERGQGRPASRHRLGRTDRSRRGGVACLRLDLDT